MDSTQIVGSIAAVMTTTAFVPQAVKIIRTKSTKDISLGMYVILTTGILFWLIYGILLGEAPIIFANTIGFILTFIILILKIKYRKSDGRN
ncbi:MAG: SemiSWEET transporter [Candidatus Kapaibacteriota bacterium]|jgi:MtN3 and saliva related transmembrane protein